MKKECELWEKEYEQCAFVSMTNCIAALANVNANVFRKLEQRDRT